MRNDDTYADRVVREAMLAASGGLDPDKVAEVVAKVVDAVHKQAEALKQADYKPGDYERIARAMAHAMKSADGLYRLVEFAAGRPDSRPDKATDWLRGLTDEQLRTVQGWVEANATTKEMQRRRAVALLATMSANPSSMVAWAPL
jgi:hypothetical protein